MSPATFAIATLTALVIFSHLVQLVFDLVDGDPHSESQSPSHIA